MEFEKIREIIANCTGINEDEIKPESRFKDDLGLDSLDVMEIVVEIENTLNETISDDDLAQIETVQDALEAIGKAVG